MSEIDLKCRLDLDGKLETLASWHLCHLKG